MKLCDMKFEKQVAYLRSLLSGGNNSMLTWLALFSLRYFMAVKHSKGFLKKPVLRWYLGQMAKEYVKRCRSEVKRALDGFAQAGLIEVKSGEKAEEYYLSEKVYASLYAVLEEIFGSDFMEREKKSASFFKGSESDYADRRNEVGR